MKVNTIWNGVFLFIIFATIFLGFWSYSYAVSDRSGDRARSRMMCSNDMFCQTPVYKETTSIRGGALTTVSCDSLQGGNRFDTSDGFLHIGDYYFRSSENNYVAYVDASVVSHATTSPQCVGPHMVTSATKPTGLHQVQLIGAMHWGSCHLNGARIFVTTSASTPVPSLQIDVSAGPSGCIYSTTQQNNSGDRRFQRSR